MRKEFAIRRGNMNIKDKRIGEFDKSLDKEKKMLLRFNHHKLVKYYSAFIF